MIHLTPVQQMELRKRLVRFATYDPYNYGSGEGLNDLDLFVDDVLQIIKPRLVEQIKD